MIGIEMGDLSRQAAKDFLRKIEGMLGVPRVGGATAEEKQRALSERYAGMIERLERFGPSVLARAADYMIDNRKGFPALSDCRIVCEQIQATDKEHLNPSAAKRPPKQRDWTDPAVAQEADKMFSDPEHRQLPLLALSEGWGADLWHFIAEHRRLPAGCNADGEDEQHNLKQQRLDTNADFEEAKAHPNGSVCWHCAKERGAILMIVHGAEQWIAKCLHCRQIVTCSSPIDWKWPYASNGLELTKNLSRLRDAIERKIAQMEERLIALIEG
jgi:hypothetical protein